MKRTWKLVFTHADTLDGLLADSKMMRFAASRDWQSCLDAGMLPIRGQVRGGKYTLTASGDHKDISDLFASDGGKYITSATSGN